MGKSFQNMTILDFGNRGFDMNENFKNGFEKTAGFFSKKEEPMDPKKLKMSLEALDKLMKKSVVRKNK
jgi:hypothetical protein